MSGGVYLHLVDATDGITAKTGQSGPAKLIQNGGTPVNTINPIVEVDSINAPGLYYVELASNELSQYGWIQIRYKAAQTAEFQDIGQVIAYDPYTRTQVYNPWDSGAGSPDVNYRKIAQIVREEMAKLPKPEDRDVDLTPISEGLQAILSEVRQLGEQDSQEVNLTPVMVKIQAVAESVAKIEPPKAYDDSEMKQRLIAYGKSMDGFLEAAGQTVAEVKSMLQERADIDGELKEIIGKLDDALDMHKIRRAFEDINQSRQTEPPQQAPRFPLPKLLPQ
jgi:hypothetical protein